MEASNSENTLRQTGRLGGASHHGENRALQSLRAGTGTVFQHHAEAAGGADAAHGRRHHHDDQALLDRRETLEQGALNGGGGLVGIMRPRLEADRGSRRRRPALGALVKVAPEKPAKFTAWAMPGTLQRGIDHLAD